MSAAIELCIVGVFVWLVPLTAQSQIKPAPAYTMKAEELDKHQTSQITKAPVQLQLPASLAKMAGNKPIQKVATPSAGLVTIMSENFEGNFPSGSWLVNTGDYTWAKRNCAAHDGSFSAWAVGGGASGSALTCGANYPNSVSTVMIYGPFDLSDANYAAFSFWVLLNSETNYDFFSFLTSEDGTNFSGIRLSGTTDGAWIPFTQALTAAPAGSGTFKNLTGKSTVWIAFAFSSDGSSNRPTGALVDDVVLQKGMVNVPAIVSSFSSPGPSPRGLAFDGANLWCSDATNERIYKLNLAGSILSSFSSPGPIPTGLAWDGSNLRHADLQNEKIYTLTSTGAVLSSFQTPGQFPTGLTWNGSGLWLCDSNVPTIWKLSTGGSTINSFDAPGTFHYGLAWDGQNLWLVDAEALLIYKMDIAGNVLDYYLAPGTNPSALAWESDGLWLADRDADRIYKLQVRQFAKDVGVTTMNLPNLVFLGNAITVGVTVTNFGTTTQSTFPISYSINNGPAVTESFAGALAVGASATKTFTVPWIPRVEGTYRFTAWTVLAGDESPTNDTLATPKDVLAISGRIAFVSDRDGNKEIYVMNADGSGVTRLTNNPASDVDPAWSPDGTRIAFASDRDGNFEIYVMNADGSNQIRLTNNPPYDASPAWSPDGKRIAFNAHPVVNGTTDIYVMNADGSGRIRVTDDPAYDSSPTWSPNGTQIAFMSSRSVNNSIYVMNADGSNQTLLTGKMPAINVNQNPSWSPDGTLIAFESDPSDFPDNDKSEIYVINPDGSVITKLTNNSVHDVEPAWSPDGTQIAFSSFRDGNEEIYIMNADGSGQTRVTNNSARDCSPRWGGQLTTSIHESGDIFREFSLKQNYPNPFNPATIIEYTLPKPSYIELKVYNVIGHEVQTLVNGKQEAGSYRVQFHSNGLPGGVYFYRLRAGERIETKKMLIVK